MITRVIMAGNESLAKMLIDECGAKIDYQNAAKSWTPLIFSCMAADVEGVQLALKCGADPNLETEQGETALLAAARLANKEIVTL